MALLFTYVFMAGVYNVLTYSKIDSMQTETVNVLLLRNSVENKLKLITYYLQLGLAIKP